MTCVTGSALFPGDWLRLKFGLGLAMPFTLIWEIRDNIVGEALYLDLRCEMVDSFVVIGLGFLISGLCWVVVKSLIPDQSRTPKHREKFSIHVA